MTTAASLIRFAINLETVPGYGRPMAALFSKLLSLALKATGLRCVSVDEVPSIEVDDVVTDALVRVNRILSDAVAVELSPAAWTACEFNDGQLVECDEPYLHDSGPRWEGLPGTHPLLPDVRRALKAAREAAK